MGVEVEVDMLVVLVLEQEGATLDLANFSTLSNISQHTYHSDLC